jgi:hypothetical protein
MKACCVRRRGKEIAPWLVPGGLLILIPKCPVCFAAYLAAGTGIGLSLPAATSLRGALISLCMLSLAFLAARLLFRKKLHSNKSIP